SRSPLLRKASLEAAVLLGFQGAREKLRASVKQPGAATDSHDLEALGALGAPEDARFLLGLLDRPDLAPSALRALGRLGSVSAAEPLIARMADGGLARLAGHALSTILGVDLTAERLAQASPPGRAPPPEE